MSEDAWDDLEERVDEVLKNTKVSVRKDARGYVLEELLDEQ